MPAELEIKVSERLLDYIEELERIEGILLDSLEKIGSIVDIVNVGEAYQGGNSDELYLFYHSLQLHVEKIMLFYKIAITYANHTYEEFMENDEMLSLSLRDG